MASTQEFGFNELFAQVIGEIAAAVSGRNSETAQQQFARSQAAIHLIMGFLPRDVFEALLAGHCVMLHETMLASVHDTLLGEAEGKRHATRSGIIAMNKEFNSNLGHLERYQSRPAQGRRDAPEQRPAEVITSRSGATLTPAGAAAQTRTVAEASPPLAGQQAATEQQPAPAGPAQAGISGSVAQQEPDWLEQHDPEAEMEYHPSPALVAASQANPEAMAALTAGDPERWAKALGIAVPCDAFLEAAKAPGSPFDPAATGPWPPGALPGRRTG